MNMVDILPQNFLILIYLLFRKPGWIHLFKLQIYKITNQLNVETEQETITVVLRSMLVTRCIAEEEMI